jgi:hypothetical protein
MSSRNAVRNAAAVLGLIVPLAALSAAAQEWPHRTLTLVVRCLLARSLTRSIQVMTALARDV